jgi:transposase
MRRSKMGKRYLGVDLHRNVFTVCVRYESGKSRIEEWKLSLLDTFARKLKSTDEIAVESTGNTRFFCEAVKQKVSRVVVVNPAQFKVISRSVKKTDKNDAETLALFLSKDLLPEIRMKDKLHSQISSLSQTRDKLVKLRTTLKNKINNIASSYGIQLRKEAMSSEKGLMGVLSLGVDELSKVEIEVMVEQIRSLNRGIEKLEKEICQEGKNMPGHKNLTSIKGIGEKGASILLSVIGDIQDFPDEGRLASYFGIVPRINNSNETERSGRITKRGSKLARTTLVQCTLIATRYSPYLHQYYTRIKNMRGTGKAIIATARKFLGIIYLTLKNNWIFKDFPKFVLAE